MKRVSLICSALLFALLLPNCERDDICDEDTPTTPRIVVEFYDYNDPGTLKNVTGLALQSVDSDSIITYNAVSKVFVPLKTDQDITTLNFTLNSTSADPSLVFTDKLEFNYSREDVYVSRACGYKTVFALNNGAGLAPAFVLNDTPAATAGDWIKNIVVDTYNIASENETHIRIYF